MLYHAVHTIIPKTHTIAVLRDLSYVVRGGRLPAKIKRIADLLRITPIIGVKKNGSLGTCGVIWGRTQLEKKLAQKIRRLYSPTKTYRIVIMHSHNKLMADGLYQTIKSYYPHLDSLDIVECGAALGAHVGPGALGIALQEYTPLTIQ